MTSSSLSKRVLLIAPQPFFALRGTPLNVRGLATALTEGGYEVDLLAYPYGQDLSIPGLRIIRCMRIPFVRQVPVGPSWQKIVLDAALAIRALRLALTNRYLAYHGVEEGGVIAGVLSSLTRRPYVYDMDSCIISQLSDSGFIRSKLILRIIGWMEQRCLRKARAILTVCRDLTDKARRIAPRGNIYQIEDYASETLRMGDANEVQTLRAQLKISTGLKCIVYTGNFEKYQGLELLVESLPKVEQGAILVLVGGRESDRERIRNQAAKLGCLNRIFFAGERPETEMGTFLALADVLASPRSEGTNTPLKLYTYMASGKPIVATQILSHTQVLDESCAFLCQPTSGDMANALNQALASASGHERAMKAQALVEERYNRREFVRRVQELYDDIQASRPCRDSLPHLSGCA